MLYPNLAFGKYAIAQEDRTHGKNSSNGQGKLIQKDNHYLVCQENQNMET